MRICKKGFLLFLILCIGLSITAFTPNYKTYDIPDLNMKITLPVDHYVIYGKVSLPDGRFAPSGGIKVKVAIRHFYGVASQDLIIPEGGVSVDYKLEADTSGFGLPYYILEDNYGYVLQGGYGYISSNQQLLDYNTTLSQYKDKYNKECNLTLIPSDCTIQGMIYLPDKRVADYGGEHITISASTGTEMKDKISYSRDITIPEGKNSADYLLCVQSGKEYIVSYKYIAAPRYSYEMEGFYHSKLKTTLPLTPGAIKDINLGIIDETENYKQIQKRSLTRNEYWELTEKTSSEAILLNPSFDGDKLKLTASSTVIDKWEKWDQQMASITSGAISLNFFKFKGYCLYSYEKSIKDSTLILYKSNSNADFQIKPLTTGTCYYYCQAIFDYGLRSSISNVVKITYQKEKPKIQFGS